MSITAAFHLRLAVFLLLSSASLGAAAQQKTLTYRWLNQPCAENLNCEEGCSACNMPDGQDASIVGTGAAWIDVGACPHPFAVGDNAVATDGWGLAAQEERYAQFTVLTLTHMQVDGLRLRHRSWNGGPDRVRVSFSDAVEGAFTTVYDGPVTDEFTMIEIGSLGCLKEVTGSLGGLRVKVQAYGGTEGTWVLDELAVVLAPCEPAIVTGVEEIVRIQNGQNMVPVDVLGRPMMTDGAAPGLYISGRKRVQVLP